jgi:ParB family chromosome partitioning protein
MDIFGTAPGRIYARLSLDAISPNPAQPRRKFSDEALNSLAESIREHGLLSPLLVRRIGLEKYELVAGERRYRALKMLGETQAEAIIIAAFDCDSAVLALIENIQREQINYIEEAEACRAIIDTHGITQEELARRLGRSPSALANRLRLIRLPDPVKEELLSGGLTERHGRALLSLDDPEIQLALAREASRKRLTVRQLEKRIANIKPEPRRRVRGLCRDMRLYVNAVMDTVSHLRSLGADAEVESKQTDVGIDIIIHIGNTSSKISDASLI